MYIYFLIIFAIGGTEYKDLRDNAPDSLFVC